MSVQEIVIRKATPKLGEGIYLTKDVAKILNLPYQKVYKLMSGFWDAYTFGEERNKAVNFYSLIEFYIYFHCRQNGMPAQRLKKYHTQLSKDLQTHYPFSHFEIMTDFKNMWRTD